MTLNPLRWLGVLVLLAALPFVFVGIVMLNPWKEGDEK